MYERSFAGYFSSDCVRNMQIETRETLTGVKSNIEGAGEPSP
jgi:hypothetical protein